MGGGVILLCGHTSATLDKPVAVQLHFNNEREREREREKLLNFYSKEKTRKLDEILFVRTRYVCAKMCHLFNGFSGI